MVADVFETYGISIIGTMLVAFLTLRDVQEAVIYPFLLGGISVIGAIAGIFYVNKRKTGPGRVLVEAVVASGVVSAILYLPVTTLLFPGRFKIGDQTHNSFSIYVPALVGFTITGRFIM